MIFFDLDGTLIDHKRAEILGVKGFFNKYSSYFDFNEEKHSETKMIYDLTMLEGFL